MKGLGGGWGESESLVFVGVFKVDGLGRERGRGYDNFFSKWVDSHTRDEYVLIVHIIIPINFSQCSSPCVACPGAVSKSPQTLRLPASQGERYPVTPQHE